MSLEALLGLAAAVGGLAFCWWQARASRASDKAAIERLTADRRRLEYEVLAMHTAWQQQRHDWAVYREERKAKNRQMAADLSIMKAELDAIKDTMGAVFLGSQILARAESAREAASEFGRLWGDDEPPPH